MSNCMFIYLGKARVGDTEYYLPVPEECLWVLLGILIMSGLVMLRRLYVKGAAYPPLSEMAQKLAVLMRDTSKWELTSTTSPGLGTIHKERRIKITPEKYSGIFSAYDYNQLVVYVEDVCISPTFTKSDSIQLYDLGVELHQLLYKEWRADNEKKRLEKLNEVLAKNPLQ